MNEQLIRIRVMAERLIEVRRRIEALTAQLEEAKNEERRLEREDLPELMREIGFTSFALQDGSQVELVEDLACAITEDNAEAAIAWLDDNGFGGLVKTQLLVSFNREDRSAAVELAEQFLLAAKQRAVDVAPVVNEKVHPATLKSFIKEELSKGTAVPFDLFSIHPYNKVKIKTGKG